MSVVNFPAGVRVYIDLDGVVFDFVGAATKAGLTPQEFKMVPGAYRFLPLFPDAKESIKKIEDMGFVVFFLSKCPTENPLSATEKLLAVNEHFPEKAGRVILSADKGAVGKACDYLIDDMPEWANAHSFPGSVIRHNSWKESIEKLVACRLFSS